MKRAGAIGNGGMRPALLRHVLLSLASLLLLAGCETVPVLTSTVFPNMSEAPDRAQIYYVTDRAADGAGGRIWLCPEFFDGLWQCRCRV